MPSEPMAARAIEVGSGTAAVVTVRVPVPVRRLVWWAAPLPRAPKMPVFWATPSMKKESMISVEAYPRLKVEPAER